MKQYCLTFLKRGLLAASGGPLILAMIYGILGANGQVTSLAPGEVCMGIVTVTLLAFIAAGSASSIRSSVCRCSPLRQFTPERCIWIIC